MDCEAANLLSIHIENATVEQELKTVSCVNTIEHSSLFHLIIIGLRFDAHRTRSFHFACIGHIPIYYYIWSGRCKNFAVFFSFEQYYIFLMQFVWNRNLYLLSKCVPFVPIFFIISILCPFILCICKTLFASLSLSLYLQLMVNQEKSNFGLLMPKDPVSSRWQFMDKHSLGKIQCKLFVCGEDILRSPHFLRPTSNWLSNRQRRSTRRSIRHESINNSDLNVNSANKVYVKGFKFHFPCNLAAWSNRIKLWLVALSFHVDTQPQL